MFSIANISKKFATFGKSKSYLDQHYQLNDGKNTFIITPDAVQLDKNLNANDKDVLSRIASLSNKEGYCFASDTRLSKYVGCSKRTVGSSLHKLEELGYIYKESRFTDDDITTTKRKIFLQPTIKKLFDGIRQNKKEPSPFGN
ncbi:helix-turn-helix domain-containing protein [Fructilactobacillus myrtifloralis]|uniref:Helix-turn-helix domain-containing protein n=1 Tax=Fructilactobacillus myrtifloralis TaxID=2940301 RepID=A0ABY5BN67_9LACO|nr:helix-turn-helix domain-containing protein [Fructilactobacillus myrtifloralis]USS85123.1 helix-turn-helix domain-containing protein [Fructilactobacillus myrtifloralis]